MKKKLMPLVGLPIFAVAVAAMQLQPLQRAEKHAENIRQEIARVVSPVPQQWRTDLDAVLTDTALWAVLTPPRTTDASAYLTPFLDWVVTGAKGPSSSLPDLSAGTIKATYTAEFFRRPISFTHIDLSWMAPLPSYTHFDVEAPRSPLSTFDKARSIRHAPQPNVTPLFSWARVRLAKGLADSDVTTASREVRALAAILWSFETQDADELAATIVADDAFVRGIARERGLAVEGADIPSAMVLEKVVRSVPFLFDVLTPPAVQHDEKGAARFCGAVARGASLVLLERRAFGAAFPERVTAIGQALETGPCVLARLRQQWRDGRGDDGVDITPPSWLAMQIPSLLKRWLAAELTALAVTERINPDTTWFPTEPQ